MPRDQALPSMQTSEKLSQKGLGMKSTRKRKKLVIAALFVGFCVVNFSWIHAALAGLSPASDCPASLIQTARHDVAKLYGETHAKPIPVCLTQPILGIDVSHGTTRFMPMVPSIVVLGAEGLNTDVAAHEYAHAELAERTSVVRRRSCDAIGSSRPLH